MIYLDNAATTFPKPENVYQALDNANRNNAFNAGRGHYAGANKAFSIIEDTRNLLCKKANAKSVIFTPSATHAINQIVAGIDFFENDIVYCSPYDHNAIARTLHAFSKKIGFTLKLIPLKADLSIDLDKLQFEIIKDKPKAVFCTHVSNVTGYILPISEISAISKQTDSIFVVDGAQAFGLVPVNCNTMNIDFYVFAGHKTLYGPFGVAGYFTNKINLKTSFYGGTGSDSLNLEMPKNGTIKYEPSSPNVVAIAGLFEAVNWTFSNNIISHEKDMFNYAYKKMAEIDDIVIYNDTNLPAVGIISFNIKGYNSEDLSEILYREYEICTRGGYHCCPYIHDYLDTKKTLGTVRISFSYFTTKKDIDILCDALEELALE